MNVVSVLLSEPPRKMTVFEMINLLIDNPPQSKENHQYAENPPQIYPKFNLFSSPHFLDSSPMSLLLNRQKCQAAHEKTDATQLTDLLFIVCAPLIYLSVSDFVSLLCCVKQIMG